MSTGKTLVEIICCSPQDCAIAEAAGADRIELCSAMESGGLTPSLGLLECSLARTRLPIMAMVRPRTGGFQYTRSEIQSMLADVRHFRDAGASGIVFGILDAAREVDAPRCKELIEAAGPLQTVFHRAFDALKDPFLGLEQLISLGVIRVLTSGARSSALEGAAAIKALRDQARGRIEILPGGGLRVGNLRQFIDFTGTDQVHLSAFTEAPDSSMEGVEICFNGSASESCYRSLSSDLVREVVEMAETKSAPAGE